LDSIISYNYLTSSPSAYFAKISASENKLNFINIGPTVQPGPDLVLIKDASLKFFASPVFISPQVLGTIMVRPEEEKEERDIIQYTVKEGDSLFNIAKKFGITLETLLWANDLQKSSILKSGQKLVILPVSGIMHMVKAGENINQIAKTYRAEEKEIIDFNELSKEGEIFVEDILVIPGGKLPSPTPPVIAGTSETALPNSYFIIPCQGKITQGIHFYNAIDIANQCGTPVFATAGGKIQVIDNKWPYGGYIRILHPNGVVTLYGHLSKIIVSTGQNISQGQVLGYIGNTGRTIGATGCHLHFETRGAVNPLAKYSVGTVLNFK